MPVTFYFDQNVSRVVANGLRRRGIDVVTAYEDGTHLWADAELLDRATQLGRILVTHDQDLLIEGAKRQQDATEFAGIIFVGARRIATGAIVHDLEIIAQVMEPQDMTNQIHFLPF